MLSELLIAAMLAAVPQNALDSGQQALQAGDLARAEQLFRQYLSQNPHSAKALSNLGAIFARREQFSDAVAFYEKALHENPKLTPVHFNMAVAHRDIAQHIHGAVAGGEPAGEQQLVCPIRHRTATRAMRLAWDSVTHIAPSGPLVIPSG